MQQLRSKSKEISNNRQESRKDGMQIAVFYFYE